MAQHADGERQPECVCDRRQSPFAQVVRHLVHDYRLVRELMRCPAAGAPRSWSEALAFEPTVRHGVAERSRATWEEIAGDRADGGPVRLLGTDERGDQPAAETTALGRPWSPVVQVTELSQVNLGASLGYQHCCVSITIGWSSLSRPPICPGWSSLSRPPSCPGWSSLSRPPSCPGWSSLSRPPPCRSPRPGCRPGRNHRSPAGDRARRGPRPARRSTRVVEPVETTVLPGDL